MNSCTITVATDGTIRLVYDDSLAELLQQGCARIRRVSQVEPLKTEDDIKWSADLSPVGGPILGPFATRERAIREEVDWLIANHL